MSEYQYYEFQTVDRCLTEKEMSELRTFSSRAEITPNSFINDYSWGSFKGDEDLWMEKYFDGFLYYANWGTNILKLSIPSTALDLQTVEPYCDGNVFSVRQNGDKLILDFLSESDDGEDLEADLRLSPFLSLRTDLICGDLRCLYLGWLSCCQSDEDLEEILEPPVPAGLQNLSPTLIRLADFLRIDFDLINAAAKMSPSDTKPNSQDLQKWIQTLSPSEKDSMLREILENSLKGNLNIPLQPIRRFNKEWQALHKSETKKSPQRSVDQLLKEAEIVRKERKRLEAEKKAKELAEKQRLQQIAKEKRLNEITGSEETLWNQIEALVSEMRAKSYDRAIELLIDLRDLSKREKSTDFLFKFGALKQRHSTKSAFLKRISEILV